MEKPPKLLPLTILNSTVSAVDFFKFLGSTISRDLKWSQHTDIVRKKAQQRLHFLRQLRKFNLPNELLLITFYTAIIQPVLCTSITVWFGSATKQDRVRLQWTVRAAERIISSNLPPIQDLYRSRVRKRAAKISAGHKLLKLLPSGRQYRALFAKTSCHKNSFFPQTVTLNSSTSS